MNYCKDCKFYQVVCGQVSAIVCRHEKCRDEVSGDPLFIRTARMEVCNNANKEPQYWEAK